MSLIADSLKKAIKEKSAHRMDAGPGINVVRKGAVSRHPGLMTATRFFLLIILPTAILFYLISIGAFDLRKPVIPEKAALQEFPREEPPKPAVSKTVPPGLKREVAPQKIPVKKPAKIPPVVSSKREEEPLAKQVIPSGEMKRKVAPVKPDIQPRAKEKKETVFKQITPPYPQEKPSVEKQDLAIELKPKGEEVASLPPVDGKPEISTTKPDGKGDVFENSNYFFNRGLFFQQAKEWQKALENYTRAEQLDPDNADTYNNKGVVFKELGQFDRAVDEFLRAVYLDPGYAKAYNNIGVVYFMQKNYQEAIKNYQKAIDLNPENLEAFNNLAIVYKNKNEIEKARAVLNRALSLNPDHPGTNYNLAVLYEEIKEIKPALHYYRRFIELGAVSYPSLVFEVKEHVQTLVSQ